MKKKEDEPSRTATPDFLPHIRTRLVWGRDLAPDVAKILHSYDDLMVKRGKNTDFWNVAQSRLISIKLQILILFPNLISWHMTKGCTLPTHATTAEGAEC